MKENQDRKLTQAKEILAALKLPAQQCNDRSAWVLLALAKVLPDAEWSTASADLQQTYVLMEFIRKEYEMDYKPNSRETIRRQTLHQFEQARIIDRNRDNPARATNSKDNNYSLNQEIISILKEYPKGSWKKRVEEFLKLVPALTEKYEKIREMNKIPVKLPNGKEFNLSPGAHNQLHVDIINEFCPRFVGEGGIVLYIGDTASSRNEGGKFLHLERDLMKNLGIPEMAHDKLPDIVIYDEKRNWLFLIEAVTSHGPVSSKRWEELEEAFEGCQAGRVYVTAFATLSDFRKYSADIAWETEVWIAEKQSHMIHFNGDRFLGPR